MELGEGFLTLGDSSCLVIDAKNLKNNKRKEKIVIDEAGIEGEASQFEGPEI